MANQTIPASRMPAGCGSYLPNPATNPDPQIYRGKVVHIDDKNVYQHVPGVLDDEFIKHERSGRLQNVKLGQAYEICYENGKCTLGGAIANDLPLQEGSLRVSVNGPKRTLEKFSGEDWSITEIDGDRSAHGLPTGAFNLCDAADPKRAPHSTTYQGKIVHVDKTFAYQLRPGGTVRHELGLFEKPPDIGADHTLHYARGQGTSKGLTPASPQPSLPRSR